MREYELSNNPILGFFEELSDLSSFINNPTKNLYLRYSEYCEENSIKSLGNTEFSRQVCKKFNLKTVVKRVRNKTIRVYENVTDV